MRARLAICAFMCALFLSGCAGQQEFATGQRYYDLRQYDEAINHLEAAVREDPANLRYRELLAEVKDRAALEEFRRGMMLYDKRQIDAAIAAFQRALHHQPDFADARNAYESAKRRADAIRRVLSEIPDLLRGGKPDEALEKLVDVEAFASTFTEIDALRAQALTDSTIVHTKLGNVHLKNGEFEPARREFFIALNRTPNYRPAAEGIAAAEGQIRAAALVAEGRTLLDKGDFQAAHDKFQAALKMVPGHRGALEAVIETGASWARTLYDEAKALEEKGSFDDLAEALRRYERAGALTERFAGLDERISSLKKTLAGEFLKRAEQYEQLGDEYLALALINYKMSLHCDPSQVAASRKVAEVKAAFDGKRAFFVDIRPVDQSSSGASPSKQLAQHLKETIMSSGITDLFLLAPYDETATSGGTAPIGLAGRRMTVFASVISEDVVTSGQNKPQIERSRYRVGTRYIPNTGYNDARKALAEAEAYQSDVEQRYRDATDALRRATTPEERESAEAELDFQRRLLDDAEDKTAEVRTKAAEMPEQVEEEVYQPYDYRVFAVNMQAKVEASLETADPGTLAVKSLDIITGTASAESTYNEGVLATDANGVAPKAINLPSDSELLANARDSATANAIEWLKKHVTQISRQYYLRGRDLNEIGNAEGAAEYFYAFYLSTPDKNSPEAVEAIEHVRRHTHLITDDERQPPQSRRLETTPETDKAPK